MRIIIARPEPQASQLAAKLTALGHQCLAWPALWFSSTADSPSFQYFLSDFDCNDLIIVTSQQVAPVLAQAPKMLDLIKQQQIFTIGRSTARSLEAIGLTNTIYPATPDSNNLLALRELQQTTATRLWLLRGQSGRELIKETLTNQNIEVIPVACYRRHYKTKNIKQLLAFWQQGADLAVCTSLACLQSLEQAVPETCHHKLWHSTPITVIGEKMLNYCQTRARPYLTMPAVDNDTLVYQIERYHHGKTH